MKLLVFLLLIQIVLLCDNAKAFDCSITFKSHLVDFKNYVQFFQSSKETVSECLETEITDYVFDPYKIQSLAMNLCEKNKNCKDYLIKETARISKKDLSEFDGKNTIFIWSEMLKYSAFYKTPQILISDLPLSQNIPDLYEKIKKERYQNSSLNKSDSIKFACTALAAMIGPGKLKAVKVAEAAVKTGQKIQQSHEVIKLLKNNRLPSQVKTKFEKWVKEIEEKGLEEVKKIPGYHDEPIKELPGIRSVRCNDGYRICYETIIENGLQTIKVFNITNNHKDYCR